MIYYDLNIISIYLIYHAHVLDLPHPLYAYCTPNT